MAARIRQRWEELTNDRGLPYKLTQLEFSESGSIAREANLPEGTWLTIQIEDPLTSPAAANFEFEEVLFDKLLELHRDSIAPFFDTMDFVVGYLIFIRDAQGSVFQIDAFDLGLYVHGEITTKQMIQKMNITVDA